MIFVDFIEVTMVVINFIILVLLLKELVYKPVTDLLDKRIEKINSDLSKAENKRLDAEKVNDEAQKFLSDARVEALHIKENAVNDSQKRAKEIIDQAEKDRERIISQAKQEIDLEYANAKNELKNEISNIAVNLAGKLINANMDKRKNAAIIREYTGN